MNTLQPFIINIKCFLLFEIVPVGIIMIVTGLFNIYYQIRYLNSHNFGFARKVHNFAKRNISKHITTAIGKIEKNYIPTHS